MHLCLDNLRCHAGQALAVEQRVASDPNHEISTCMSSLLPTLLASCVRGRHVRRNPTQQIAYVSFLLMRLLLLSQACSNKSIEYHKRGDTVLTRALDLIPVARLHYHARAVSDHFTEF